MESSSTAEILERLIRVETELGEVRRGLVKLHWNDLAKKNPGSLRGIWKGIVIDEEDVAETKASLFPERNF